jgi:leader peptidase (prepilin peptidase) / N-methyltransferase
VISIILFVIYGLAVGSFCNVVISRMRTGENMVVAPSHCPTCKMQILWRDNIPLIGYMMLRGKCRNCKKKISIQYPVVEFLTAALFGLVGYFYVIGFVPLLITAILLSIAMACLVVIFVYDAKYMEIPMIVMWIAIALFFAVNVFTDLHNNAFEAGFWDSMTVMHGISALVAFCFFFGLSYVSDETWMGYGDAFVAIAIGLLLGPMGTFIALLFAFCVGALYGVVLMMLRRKNLKSEVPFGPFLITGMIVSYVLSGLVTDVGMFFL